MFISIGDEKSHIVLPNTYTLQIVVSLVEAYLHIQLLTSDYKRLLNKPYENEVTLRGQNPPLKCCRPLELLSPFKME